MKLASLAVRFEAYYWLQNAIYIQPSLATTAAIVPRENPFNVRASRSFACK
jgi:hypothetical protein